MPTAHLALDLVMIAATTVGLPLVLAIAIVRASSTSRRRAIAIAYAIGLALTVALQVVTARPRPTGLAIIAAPATPSFPSGHAVLVAIAVGFCVASRDRSLPWLTAGGVLVAMSRVHVGHHFTSDVIGGLLVGLPIGLAAHGIVEDRGTTRSRWLGAMLGPMLGLVAAVSLLASVGGLTSDRVPLLALPGIDKVLHLLFFGAVAFFGRFALGPRAVGHGWVRIPLAVLVPGAIACAEELLQAISPHRTVDVLDLGSDAVGIVLGVALAGRIAARQASVALVDPSHRRVQTSRPESP